MNSRISIQNVSVSVYGSQSLPPIPLTTDKYMYMYIAISSTETALIFEGREPKAWLGFVRSEHLQPQQDHKQQTRGNSRYFHAYGFACRAIIRYSS